MDTNEQTHTLKQTDINNPTMIGDPITHTHDTTRFTSEGKVATADFANTHPVNEHMTIVNDEKQHTIVDFLKRPKRIATINWTADNAAHTRLGIYHINYYLPEMLSSRKIDGFYGFSGRAVLRVLANAQPFHSGILQIAYLPKYGKVTDDHSGSVKPDQFYFATNNDEIHLRYESGCPCVNMNLGSTSEATLSAPYIGSHTFLTPSECVVGNFGAFSIRVLTKLRDSTDMPKIPLDIFLSFEDVKLYATTPNSWTNPFYKKPPDSVAQSNIQHIANTIGKTVHNIRTGAKPQVEEAEDNAGPISGIANTVGNIASSLTAIPGISDIAGPVSWISKGVSSVAKMFGFSKPHSVNPSEPRWTNPFKDFNHCEGVDHSTKLTVNTSQEVEVKAIGPEQKDEMNMSYILSRPCYMDTFTWTTSNDSGLLGYWRVNPRHFKKTMGYQSSTDTLTSHTYLSYLAGMFMYWMGTIRFTFTVAGNKFYSGRLRFVYVPELPKSKIDEFASNVFNDEQHTYYHVVDIRDANTFTVDCGFISPTPWKDCRYKNDHGDAWLMVFVEQRLAAPETVSQTLDVAVHVSALDDFNFAGPCRPRRQACNGFFIDGAPESQAQGFTAPPTSKDVPVNIPIVNDVTRSNPVEAHKVAIGDPITSLRTLIKRMMPNSLVGWQSHVATIQPFKLLYAQEDQRTTISHFQAGDFIDHVLPLFRFWKGGVRVAVSGFGQDNVYVGYHNTRELTLDNVTDLWKYDSSTASTRAGIIAEMNNLPDGAVLPETFTSSAYCVFPHQESIQGILQVEIPYYHKNALVETSFRRYILDGKDANKLADDMTAMSYDSNVYTNNILTLTRDRVQPVNLVVFRAAADDFNCGFLLGPPPTRDYIPVVVHNETEL